MARALIIALLLTATPALAFDTGELGQGGSLALDDLTALIDSAPQLKREVAAMLAEKHKTMENTICVGKRFSGKWEQLGGARVAPYDCDFNGKWLHIDATVRLTGKGREFERVSTAAMRDADDVKETLPRWKWSDKPPPDMDK